MNKSSIEKDLADAKENFEIAIQSLKLAKDRYERSPIQSYLEQKTNIGKIKEQIEQNKQETASHKEKLAKELIVSNGFKNQEITNILDSLNSSTILNESNQQVLKTVESNALSTLKTISPAVNSYIAMHENACNAWSIMNAISIAADIHDRVHSVITADSYRSIKNLAGKSAKNVLQFYLERIIVEAEKGINSGIDEVGELNICSAIRAAVLTPAQCLMNK
jgi:hypothetical protein